jgi:hypothetical protein
MKPGRRNRGGRRYLLDFGRLEDIPKSKVYYQQFLKYHWEYYSEVAFQRAQIYEALKDSLREKTAPFHVAQWQRAVKYKHTLDPLNTKGSLIDPGGRFNIGAIDPIRFTVFPGLYLASDKDTALDELFARDKQGRLLSPEELALTKMGSLTIVSTSGNLESVFDLRDPKNLAGFAELVKDFRLPVSLVQEANRLNIRPPRLIRNVSELMQCLLEPNWRAWPMRGEVPAQSQIFGQIVSEAGIEGIVYPSVLSKKPCLVVYPQNFANSSAFVEIDGPAPVETIQKRIDATSFNNSI